MKPLIFFKHDGSFQGTELENDKPFKEVELNSQQRKKSLSAWLARRKIERIKEKKRLRKRLEDYKHFALDMIKNQ